MRQVTKTEPVKSLTSILPNNSGRNNTGKITARYKGGRKKRFYRKLDFKRDKLGIVGRVIAFEYDPNRNVQIALIYYQDGEKRYILAPLGLLIGDLVKSGKDVEVKPGNSLPLESIPIGTSVHNLELVPGRGGQLVRGAGTAGNVLSKEDGFVHVKLPSGEVRKIRHLCYATVGQLANIEAKTSQIGKAGRSRLMGIRPKVRGTAQNPRSHPHGGGEGRSGEGMHAKTAWGKRTRGVKTRKKHKYSDRYILQRRK